MKQTNEIYPFIVKNHLLLDLLHIQKNKLLFVKI